MLRSVRRSAESTFKSVPAEDRKYDPIFAAIDAHKHARVEFGKAVDEEDKFAGSIALGSCHAKSPKDIHEAVGHAWSELLSNLGSHYAKRLRPEIDKIRLEMLSDLEDARTACEADIAAAEKRLRMAYDRVEKTFETLGRTVPATTEGVAAFAAYIASMYEDQLQNTWADDGGGFLATLARAAEQIADHQ